MEPGGPLEQQVQALDEGRAFVQWPDLCAVAVTGAETAGWLNDLVTAGVAELAAGEARRSLLLTPTGRIRADLHVVRMADGFLLLQRTDQPARIEDLLAPYVLSSDVSLSDRSEDLAVFSAHGADLSVEGGAASRPSLLGQGADLLAPAADRDAVIAALTDRGLVPAGEEAVEIWRIRRGVPRFPADLDEDSLPAEAGLEAIIDFTKGCFLGQESVAKVRNLGHPPRVVLALRSEGAATTGDPVMAGAREVGVITSAAPAPGGTAVLARVRWEARSEALATAAGRLAWPA